MYDPHDEATWDDKPGKSRTQKKKEMKALQKMSEKLADLAPSQLDRIPMPDFLREAIRESPQLKKREAYRRHMQYLGKLIREADTEPIEDALRDLEEGRQANAGAFHELENMRDRLMNCAGGDLNAVIESVLERFPEGDRGRLSQLARSARAEKAKNKPPKSFRALFRYLRDLSEEKG